MTKARFLEAMSWCVLASMVASSAAFALCQDGRYPDVPTEFKASNSVVTGFVVSSRNVSSPEDPQGYEFTIYTFRVFDVFKGKVGQLLEITSENSSGGFPMHIGEKYLLFIRTFGQENIVDPCGKSGPLDKSQAELKAVVRMSEKR
jgi:hypothetical protein